MDKIIYIGNFFFPDYNAAGVRVLNNGYLFRELGYEVVFIGLERKNDISNNLKNSRFNYDGFDCYCFPYPNTMSSWFFIKDKLNQTKSLITSINPSLVITYGSVCNSIFALLLNRWCLSNKIKIIHDCVDWLAGGSGGLLFRILKYIDTDIQKRYVNSNGDGLIVVSRFLQDYYENKNCKTLLLPPLQKSIKFNKLIKNNDSIIKIIYAGYPFPTARKIISKKGIKDRLDLALEVLFLSKRNDFVFNIFGITQQEYLEVIPNHKYLLEKNKNKFIFHGKVKKDIIENELNASDFFLLLRDDNRMTNAGFPSKVVESLACNLPVVTNNTSDLSKYIVDNINGFILKEKKIEALSIELDNVLGKIRNIDKTSMDNPFDIKYYKSNAKKFLEEI